MWRQDGRSASMTAPNGPSQQACILQSMREVSTSASSFQVNCSVQFTGFTRETVWKITFEAGNKARDINLAECHGTGGMCFFSSHSLRSQFFKNKSYGNNWGPKNHQTFQPFAPVRYCFGWSYWGRCSEECHGTKGYYLGTDQLEIQHWAFGGQRRGIPVLVVGRWKLKVFFLRRNENFP